MLVRKVTQHVARGKTRKVPAGVSAEYDHHIALDWSLKDHGHCSAFTARPNVKHECIIVS